MTYDKNKAAGSGASAPVGLLGEREIDRLREALDHVHTQLEWAMETLCYPEDFRCAIEDAAIDVEAILEELP